MTNRKRRKALARWEKDIRQWAHETARNLVLSIVSGQPAAATPYGIGVVLDRGEQVWAECPIRFLQENLSAEVSGVPLVRPWLVTSDRIVGRLGDDHLYGWRWEHVRGCRVDLSAPTEFVAVDLDDGCRLDWIGPGIAPLAIAAVYQLHGSRALIDHPGLEPLRVPASPNSAAHQQHRPQETYPSNSDIPPPWEGNRLTVGGATWGATVS